MTLKASREVNGKNIGLYYFGRGEPRPNENYHWWLHPSWDDRRVMESFYRQEGLGTLEYSSPSHDSCYLALEIKNIENEFGPITP